MFQAPWPILHAIVTGRDLTMGNVGRHAYLSSLQRDTDFTTLFFSIHYTIIHNALLEDLAVGEGLAVNLEVP